LKNSHRQPFPQIFFLAAAYCLGIIVAYFNDLPLLALGAAIFICLFLWITFSVRAGTSEKGKTTNSINPVKLILPYLIFLLLGMLFTSIKTNLLKQSLLKQMAKDHVCTDIYGTVLDEPKDSGDCRYFVVRVERVEVLGKYYKVNEFVKLGVKKDGKRIDFNGGEQISIKNAVLTVPSNAGFRRYLYNQEIQTISVVDRSQIEITERAPFLSRLLNSIRQGIRKKAFNYLQSNEAGLLLGILLGYKEGISSLMQADFSKAGVSHVIVVSGLHVGMISLICFWFTRLLKIRAWQRYCVVVILVILYALLTGCKPSILRASLLVGAGALGWMLGREKRLLALLSAAALFLLTYNPFFLFDIAFQLSFAASLGIAVIAPILELQFSQSSLLSHRFLGIVPVTVAAQLGVIPITLYHFREISIISVLANVIVVPLIAPILTLGIIGFLLSCVSGIIAIPVFAVLDFLLRLVINVVSFFANLSFASLSIGVSVFGVICLYAILAALIIYMCKRETVFKPRTLVFISLIIPIGLVWWRIGISLPPREFRATFLDVGQGDAVVIRAPDGACVLVDGGQDPQVLKKLLLEEGVCKIDLMVLSHPHADHLNGLIEVAQRSSIGSVLVGRFANADPVYGEFKAVINERNIPCLIAQEGMKLKVGSDMELVVLSDSGNNSFGTDLNNSSVVAKLFYKEFSILFPGDIESKEELDLLDWKDELRSSVLKVAHHGSSNSTCREFLKYAEPIAAVISVGKNNRFGHPSNSTVDVLESCGAKIYRTDKNGNVTITSDGRGFKVCPEK